MTADTSGPQRPTPRPRPRPAPTSTPRPMSVPERSATVRHRRGFGQRTSGERTFGQRTPGRRRLGRRGLVALVVAVVVLAAASAGAVFLTRDRSSEPSAQATPADPRARLSDTAVAQGFIAGATSDIAAVTSYDYRNLAGTLASGASVTTGVYRRAFRTALTSGPLAVEARRVHRVQTFDLLVAGIGEISGDARTGTVLIFGSQAVTDDATRRTGPRKRPAKRRTVRRTTTGLVTLTATIEHDGDRYLISRLVSGGSAGLPPGTAGLAAAAEAAREEVAALLTFRRASFAADLRRALGGAVGPLRAQISTQAAGTRKALRRGRYDLTGTVTAIAVGSAAGDSAVLLVGATGTRTGSGGASTQGRYAVTVVRVGDGWRTSRVDPVTAG